MVSHRVRALLLGAFALAAVPAIAQKPPSEAGPLLSFAALTDNVGGAPDSIRLDVLRWSTDAERDKLMAAWNMTGGTGRAGGRGGAGRGPAGRAGGRAGAAARGPAPEDIAPDPDAVDDPFAAFAARNRGPEAPPPTPESSLAAALKQTGTVGYLWSSEVAGYAIRYAGKVTGPDGGQRIILMTDRRLGKTNVLWKPTGAGTPAPYDFSVIELRVNAKGEGEGKISLVGKIVPDSAAKILAPENYATLPVVLKDVKYRVVKSH